MSNKLKGLLFFILEVAVLSGILYFVKLKLAESHHHEVNTYLPMLIDIAFLSLFANFGGKLAKAFGIAPMAGKIIMGIVAGPAALGVLQPDAPGVEFARLVGVLFILFEAGLHFDMDLLKKNIGIAALVAFGGVFVPLITFALMGHYIFGMEWMPAIFLGGVFTATSVGLSVEALKRAGKLDSNLGNQIVGAAVIDDILGVIILTVLAKVAATSNAGSHEVAHDTSNAAEAVSHGAEVASHGAAGHAAEVATNAADVATQGAHAAEAASGMNPFVGLAIGVVVFLVSTYVLWNMGVADKIANYLNKQYSNSATGIFTRFFFGMLMVGSSAAALLGLEPVLGAFGIGVVLSKVDNEVKHDAWEKIEGYMHIFVGGFLVSIGTMLPREALLQPKVWMLAIVFTIVGFLGKYVVKYFFKDGKDGKLVAYAMAIRGEVGLVFVAVALANDALDPTMASAALLGVIIVTVLGAILFEKEVMKQVKEEKEDFEMRPPKEAI